jgi:hypothetical protein
MATLEQEGRIDGTSAWKLSRAFVRRLEGTEAGERGGSGRPSAAAANHGDVMDELLEVASELPRKDDAHQQQAYGSPLSRSP